jgi:hypothetical protein
MGEVRYLTGLRIAAVAIAGALAVLLSSCGGRPVSNAARAESAVRAGRAEIEALKAKDCGAEVEVADDMNGHYSRTSMLASCKDLVDVLTLGAYVIGKVVVKGPDRADVMVSLDRTDPYWGPSHDTDVWHVRRTTGKWRVDHKFGM